MVVGVRVSRQLGGSIFVSTGAAAALKHQNQTASLPTAAIIGGHGLAISYQPPGVSSSEEISFLIWLIADV